MSSILSRSSSWHFSLNTLAILFPKSAKSLSFLRIWLLTWTLSFVLAARASIWYDLYCRSIPQIGFHWCFCTHSVCLKTSAWGRPVALSSLMFLPFRFMFQLFHLSCFTIGLQVIHFLPLLPNCQKLPLPLPLHPTNYQKQLLLPTPYLVDYKSIYKLVLWLKLSYNKYLIFLYKISRQEDCLQKKFSYFFAFLLKEEQNKLFHRESSWSLVSLWRL